MASPVHLGSRLFVIVILFTLVTIFSCDVFGAANNVRNAAVAQPTDKRDALNPGPADASIWVPYTSTEGNLTDSLVLHSRRVFLLLSSVAILLKS